MSRSSFLHRYAPQILLFIAIIWMLIGTVISMSYVYYTWFYVYNDVGHIDGVSIESIKHSLRQYGHKGRDVVGTQFIPILLMIVATIWSCIRTAEAKNLAEQVAASDS